MNKHSFAFFKACWEALYINLPIEECSDDVGFTLFCEWWVKAGELPEWADSLVELCHFRIGANENYIVQCPCATCDATRYERSGQMRLELVA